MHACGGGHSVKTRINRRWAAGRPRHRLGHHGLAILRKSFLKTARSAEHPKAPDVVGKPPRSGRHPKYLSVVAEPRSTAKTLVGSARVASANLPSGPVYRRSMEPETAVDFHRPLVAGRCITSVSWRMIPASVGKNRPFSRTQARPIPRKRCRHGKSFGSAGRPVVLLNTSRCRAERQQVSR